MISMEIKLLVIHLVLSIISTYFIINYVWENNLNHSKAIDFEIKDILDKCHLCVNNYIEFNNFANGKHQNQSQYHNIYSFNKEYLLNILKNISNNESNL